MSIGNGRPKCDKRDHWQIGHGDPRQRNRCRKPFRSRGKTRGKQHDNGRHHDLEDNHHSQQHKKKNGLHLTSKTQCRSAPIFSGLTSETGYKSVAQRPLCTQPPKHVGQLQCHKKGVSRRTCAQKGSKNNIPQKTQNTTGSCQHANLAKGPRKR